MDAAIIDDAGRPMVFTQKGGETFVRRPVKTGVTNSGLVQILEGIHPGYRVVTKGAYHSFVHHGKLGSRTWARPLTEIHND